MTRQEIVQELVQGKWTHADLEVFWSALKDVRTSINAVAKYQFQAGDRVSFQGRGRLVLGTVEKLLTKNISVKADSGVNWSVSASALTKIG